MLADLLSQRRDEVLRRCLAKIRTVPSAGDRPSDELLDHMTHFYDQMIAALGRLPLCEATGLKTTGQAAPLHARQRWQIGFRLDQVVHDYGFLCDAITETAEEARWAIEVGEYRVLNQSMDTAIAEAVDAWVAQQRASDEHRRGERVGFIVHELRNALTTSRLALGAMRQGQLSSAGRTAGALDRSLRRQEELVQHLINDIRLRSNDLEKVRLPLATWLRELEEPLALRAATKRIQLSVTVGDDAAIEADRLLLASAVMNLAINAIKYTPEGGRVQLRARRDGQQVTIEVEDECGGLSDTDPDELFEPFVQRHADRSGLGLGLSIARQAVQRHDGTIRVRNLPGRGCVFTIMLPARSC